MCKITKNKYLYFLIVSLLIISGLYVNRKNSIVEKNGNEIYSEIINQYTKIITNKIYNDLPDNFEKIGTHINTYLIMDLIRYPEYKAYYAIEDIDKNGVPELFIGGSENNDVYRCYDIFLFDKTNIIRLFINKYGEFGNRNNIYYLKNGIIDVEWTNSGSNNGMDFYQIESDAIYTKLLESISLDARHTETGLTTKYFNDKEGKTEISEEKFYSILHKFKGGGYATLSWNEFN